MSPSWLLYGLGMRTLLQMGVTIRTDEHLVSFCHFMRRNLPSCAHHLTQLSICISRYRPGEDGSESDLDTHKLLQGSPLLVPVVRQFTHLEVLSINLCEELLECDERLVDAFASLTTVRMLHVTSFGLRTYDLVNTIQSPLVDVHVDGEFPAWDAHSIDKLALILPDPLEMLCKHQATLEKVFIRYFDLTARFVRPSPTTSVFPGVSALAILDSRIIERSVLVDAFPNLRKLEVTGELNTEADNHAEDLRAIILDEAYDLNCADPRSWDELDHVYGEADTVFPLGLHGHVRRLDMLCEKNDGSLRHMQTIVADVQPTRLVLHCAVPFPRVPPTMYDYTISPARLADLFGEEPLPDSVTHFGLNLGLPGISSEPIHYQKAIVELLSPLKIRFFTFRLHAAHTEYEDELGEQPSPEYLAILSKFHGKFLAFWTARLAKAVPTLEHLCFRVWNREVYWRISHDLRGTPHFTRLEVDAGRALVLAEGIQWYCGAKPAQILSPEESAALYEAMLPDYKDSD